jgi:Cytochrome c553
VTIHAFVKSVVAAVLVTAIASPVLAQEGNAQAGKGKITACLACHGEAGNDSTLPNVPKIGGQGQKYLLKQLRDIKSGARVVPLMAGILDNFNDQDLADLAAWYSTQEAPLGAVDPALREQGEVLFKAGNASIGVAACSACHAVDGKGIASAGFPALSGQDPAYTEAQLKAFRAGERTNDDAAVMRSIAARLSDTEIAALASFVFGVR